MPPPLQIVQASDLEADLNARKKPRDPKIVLSDCALKELVQYKCNLVVDEAKSKRGKKEYTVVCEPLVRMLRMCENGMSVETTAWEGRAKTEGSA